MDTDKTEEMLITAKPFVGSLRKLGFGNDNIKFVNVYCSLGVYIDSQLKWDKSLKMVTKSYSAKLLQLKRLRYLPKSNKLKRDKIINKISCKKEAAIGTNKIDDFYYYSF